jgi:hypothetical protein
MYRSQCALNHGSWSCQDGQVVTAGWWLVALQYHALHCIWLPRSGQQANKSSNSAGVLIAALLSKACCADKCQAGLSAASVGWSGGARAGRDRRQMMVMIVTLHLRLLPAWQTSTHHGVQAAGCTSPCGYITHIADVTDVSVAQLCAALIALCCKSVALHNQVQLFSSAIFIGHTSGRCSECSTCESAQGGARRAGIAVQLPRVPVSPDRKKRVSTERVHKGLQVLCW